MPRSRGLASLSIIPFLLLQSSFGFSFCFLFEMGFPQGFRDHPATMEAARNPR